MSSSVKAILAVVILVIIGGGIYFLTGSNSNSDSDTEQQTSVNTTNNQNKNDNSSDTSSSDLAGPITEEQVKLHDKENDCWTIINGNVYDLSSYIGNHPGGDNILSACGKDSTEYFNGQKAGQNGGTNNHNGSSSAISRLDSLKLGPLAEN